MTARRSLIAAALVVALGLAPLAAGAYQVPSAPFEDSATTARTTMPGSGLVQTISVSGKTALSDPSTAGERGTSGRTYSPPIARTTPAQDLVVDTGDCASTGSCGSRGTVTITFSQPVRDPVLHVAGIGGAATQTVNGRPTGQSELHSVLELTTAGISLTKVGEGNNLAVTSDTITAANPDAGPNCINPKTGTGPDAAATAACGSVRVLGVVKSIAFDVTVFFTKNRALPAFNTPTSGDVFSIVASVGEDFGDAPASYGAAWSVLGDARLGSTATEDNATVPNGTSGPAVPDLGDDGVTFKPLRTKTKSYAASVALTGTTKPGRVCGWIDLDKRGTFAATERSCATFTAGQGAVTLNWSNLAGLTAGTTYARVRLGYTATQVEKPAGAADSGEVEDYPVVIAPPPPPIAVDDVATTAYDTGATADVLGNDKAADPEAPLVPDSLCLVDGGKCGVMVNVVGQGKYVASSGKVGFDPVPGFAGVGKPVTYRIADSNGTTATAKLTVTVSLPAKPVAGPDLATTPQNVSTAVTVLANDKAAPGVTLNPTTLVLRDPADAALKKSVVIPREGTYTARSNGPVDFVPLARFTGVATTLGYRVTDSTGQYAESTLTITVTPVIPKAIGDSVATPFDTEVDVDVLGNDLPGSPDAPLDPASLHLVDPAGDLVDNLAVLRQGTYLVADGKIMFQPVSGFRGTATPVGYQVLDKNGTAARAQLVVSVDAPGPPVATADTVTTKQGSSVFVEVLANDKPGPTGSALDPATVRLLRPTTRSRPVTSLVIAGQGKYTARPDGRILFEPVPAFHGKATPVTYQVADGNGAVGTATLTLSVTAVQPDANDDAVGTAYDTTVTVSVLANDEAGDPGVPLVPASVRLIDPITQKPATTVKLAGQAALVAKPDGTVDFDPLPTFTGTAAPVGYTVSDVNGTVAKAILTVTVAKPPAPTARPDTATGKQDLNLTVDPLANDEAGKGTGLDPASLVLIDPADGAVVKTVEVHGEGRYTVVPGGAASSLGRVVFDPVPTFTGRAKAMSYQVGDRFGQTARSTITITITAITPVAVDDIGSTPYDVTVHVNVLGNDKAGDPSAPLVPGSLRLKDPADGLLKTKVVIAHEGDYTVATGVVTFDPTATFAGAATPVFYQVADDNGTVASAVIKLTVGAPPVARPDTASTLQNVTVTVNVLSNDSPGTDASLDASSVVIGVQRDFSRTVTVPGQGTYAVQASGAIQFDPLPSFHGKARPISYRVADSNKTVASSTLTMTVIRVLPSTVNDSAITPFNRPITVNVLGNDKAGDPSAPLVPGSVVLKDGSTYGKSLTRPGEGRFAVNADGSITFTPVKDFQGATGPAQYRVSDGNGTTATGLLFVTVGKGPEARPDLGTTKQNHDVTMDVLGNDSPGTSAELVRSSLRLFDGRSWVTSVAIAGQGTFKVPAADARSGGVTFDPVPSYSGPSSISYQVADTTGNTATSTVTVAVTPIVPSLADDTASTAYDTAVTVPVLANDKPGDPSAPLDAATVRVIDPATGNAAASLQVAGQGTFTVQPDGGIRLLPEAGASGATTPVTYQVGDANGTTATATVTVTIGAKPVALPDLARTKQNQRVTFDPLVNDKPGAGATLDPATLLLVDTNRELVSDVTVPGQGTYTVADGKITFAPTASFSGTTRPTAYEVKDSARNAARSTVTVTVVPVRPEAVDDAASTAYGTAVNVSVLTNDKAGDPSSPLVPSSVVLRDPADGTEKTSVTIAGEGDYLARPDGTVGYTPVKGFTGTTSSLTYRISDANGTSDTARLEITVRGPGGAKAIPDSGTGTPGNPVVVNPLLNDAATRGAVWRPGSVCLVTGPAVCGKQVAVPSVGQWTVGTDGTIRLVPERGFTGTAKQAYRVTDSNEVSVTAQVKVTIGAQAAASIQHSETSLPATGGPSGFLLTLGGLLAALGAALLLATRRGRQ
ncbi:CshA-type fibril repeat protein [Kribbella voronezhensis]|uniref:CshA-type fibril repeat protein n=1 Tax=Kribbella voronezhensis TaxID=2512212 RepID=A0A4R7TJV6_9ACTN|nr:tandem-95 repeat protein [Kribbella voronezhensis]TDU91938.1 CshA-type fibril repeat protein [Kribbella voronezhensis]